SHSLAVEALNSLGTASSPTVWTWFLDLTPPAAPRTATTTSTDTPPSQTAPVLVFGSDDPSVAGFVCVVDGAAPVPCASGYQPSVGDGSHTVVVKTVDAAGNVSSTGLTFTFTVDTTAPTLTTTVPATLVAPAVLTFSEDVVGVTAAAARLVSGTSPVATALSCRSSAGAVVPCSGPVRRAVLAPSPRLVPGQRYATALAVGITDLAGNAAVLRTAAFRGQLAQQESSPAAVSAWRSATSSAAYGGRYSTSDVGGSTATYAFHGTGITWFTATGPAMGTARVYVDGAYKGTVNNYASASHWRVARTIGRLTNATHTLRVVPTGARGSVYGKGTSIVVDAVKVGTSLTTNPAVRTSWAVGASSRASGGHFAVADDAGATFSMVFRGSRLTWMTAVGRNMGVAKVYVDGVLKGTYDNYSQTAAFNLKRSWSLTDKLHTVRVVVQGRHRPGAIGSRVVVDALLVG
ncbi:MAG: Ig-like domain-containing protein, partial [Mycobacteriales bacterium]